MSHFKFVIATSNGLSLMQRDHTALVHSLAHSSGFHTYSLQTTNIPHPHSFSAADLFCRKNSNNPKRISTDSHCYIYPPNHICGHMLFFSPVTMDELLMLQAEANPFTCALHPVFIRTWKCYSTNSSLSSFLINFPCSSELFPSAS